MKIKRFIFLAIGANFFALSLPAETYRGIDISAALKSVSENKNVKKDRVKRTMKLINDLKKCEANAAEKDKEKIHKITCEVGFSAAIDKLETSLKNASEKEFVDLVRTEALKDIAARWAESLVQFKKSPKDDLKNNICKAMKDLYECPEDLKKQLEAVHETKISEISKIQFPLLDAQIKNAEAKVSKFAETYRRSVEKVSSKVSKEEQRSHHCLNAISTAVYSLQESDSDPLISLLDYSDENSRYVATELSGANPNAKFGEEQWKTLIDGQREKIKGDFMEIIDTPELTVDHLMSVNPESVGRTLYLYPDTLGNICKNLVTKGDSKEAEKIREDILVNTAAPSNVSDKVVTDWLKKQKIECSQIKEAYKDYVAKNPNWDKDYTEVFNSYDREFTKLKSKFNLLGTQSTQFQHGLGLDIEGCGSDEYRAFERDMKVRAIKFFKKIDSDPKIMATLKEAYERIEKMPPDEKRALTEMKMGVFLGFLSRLPESSNDKEVATQDKMLDIVRKKYLGKGEKPGGLFLHDLDLVFVKDSEVAMCRMVDEK
jgi:hypothetical protein